MPDERYEDASRRINELKEEINHVIADTTISSRQRKNGVITKKLINFKVKIIIPCRYNGAD